MWPARSNRRSPPERPLATPLDRLRGSIEPRERLEEVLRRRGELLVALRNGIGQTKLFGPGGAPAERRPGRPPFGAPLRFVDVPDGPAGRSQQRLEPREGLGHGE